MVMIIINSNKQVINSFKQLLDNDLTTVIKTLLKNSDLLAKVWYLEMYCSCVVCICGSIAKG